MARRAGRSAPALRGSRGPSPRSRGPSPGGPPGGPPPGPPPPPEPPAPPTEKDIQRQRLRDIMDRKVVVWDRMFETEKDEDRRRGLERFKKLSEEEMALATRNLSKSKLKEFIDLKIHYFDQLANAKNEDKRLEGLRRFKKVGDDEYFLARTVGPDDNLDEVVKRRDERDKEEQAKAEIEKAQKEMEEKRQQQIKEMEKLQQQQMEQAQQAQLDQMKQQLLQQQQMMQDPLYPSMSDPLMAQMMDMSGVPDLAGMTGLGGLTGLAGLSGAGMDPMASEWAANLALGFPAPLNPEDIYAQAQQALLEQQLAAQGPLMPPPPKPPQQQPQYATGSLPPLFFPTPHLHDPQLFSPRARRHPLASRMQGMTPPRGAAGMDIGNKMRLLTQLEATRRALQSQPVGSRSSMAEEIKDNLRKLNNLKMRLIEDIMGGDRGSGGRRASFDVPVERGRRSPQRVEKSTKDRKIIVEFVGPGVDPALATEVGAAGGEGPKDMKDRKESPSVAFLDVTTASGGGTCPMHQCRAHQQCIEMDFIPPVPEPMPAGAERPASPPTSQDITLQPPSYPPYPMPQDPYAQYQPRPGLYSPYMGDPLAQYPPPFDPYSTYTQPPMSSDASRPEVIWERQDPKSFAEKSTMVDPPEALKYLEAAVTNDGQQVVKEVYKRFLLEEAIPRPASPQPAKQLAPQQVFVPMPLSRMDQGTSFGDPRVISMHEIGISVMPMQDEQQGFSPGEPRVIETRKGPLVSKTTIVVNRPEPPEPTQIILPPPPPPPAPPPPPPPPPLQPPPPAPAPVSRPASSMSEQTTPPRSPRVKEGATLALRTSMERLVNSIDDMFDSLTTRRARSRSRARSRAASRARSRRRRRSSSPSYSDDDDYDDYDSRPPPRYRRRARRREFEEDRDDEGDNWDDDGFDYDTTYYRSQDKGESRSRKTRSRDRSREKSRSPDELPSLWGWLCRSLCNITDMPQDRITTRTDPRDVRVLQMGSRIRTLIQNVIRVSQEVIEARRAIQQSGLKGEDYVKNIFAAESKLWELIDLEAQLANELAMYRTSDFATDDQYFQGLAKAEDKIRRLIGVETQLAREIGNWRRANVKGAQPSRSTIYTTLSRLPSVTFSRLLPSPGSRRSPTPPTPPTASYTTSTTTTGSTASGMSGATGTTSTSTSPSASGGATPVGSGAQTPSGSSSPSSTTTTTTTTGTASTKKSKKSKSGSKKKKKKKKKKRRSKSRSSKKKRRRKKKKKRRSRSRSKRKKRRRRKKKKRRSKSRSSRRRKKKRRKKRRRKRKKS